MNAPSPAQAAPKSSGSSFYWALKLLPAAKREAMFRVYAFCREVDDIADGTDTPDIKLAQLKDYRAAVNALFAGESVALESVQNLKSVVADYHIEQADLLAVIDGMEADAFDAVRIADEAAFDLYVDQVACAVGRLSDRVFGVEGPHAEKLAHHLGRALQITNILRDVCEDAQRDRLYLPADLLTRHGVTGATLSDTIHHPKLADAMNELAERAEGCFRRADEALTHLDRTRTRPARMMKAVYWEVLKRLRERGLGNIEQPVRISKLSKLWIAISRGVFG